MLTRAHHFFIALVLGCALLLASVPYLFGFLVRPAGTLFWAVPWMNYSDANQYLALTRQAVEGRVLLADPFTQQPHAPRLFLPAVLAEAAVSRIGSLSPLVAFQLDRVISGALLLLAAYWLGTLFLRRFPQRLLYAGLLGFSAGTSWYLERLGVPWPSADVYQPEGNTFHALTNLPHLSLAAALLTALFASLAALELTPCFGRANSSAASRRPLALLGLAGACAFLLAWTHPFDLVTYSLSSTAYLLIRFAWDRKLPRAVLLHLGVVCLGAAPAAVYLVWLVQSDPVYRALANDPSVVRELRFYALAHGPLLLPAWVLLFRPATRREFLLPLCWVMCAFLFLLTPFRMGGKQPRLLGGVHAPLALLATAGVDRMTRRALGRRPEQEREAAFAGVSAVFLLATSTGVLGMVERQMQTYALRSPSFYLSPAVRGLFDYLDQHGNRSELTLGGAYTGGWAPVLADTRVYHGHWHMTLHEPQKRAERDWFFSAEADPVRKATWLRENGVRWVICYPWEWGGSLSSLDAVPGLQRVYETPEIWLYQFAGESGTG